MLDSTKLKDGHIASIITIDGPSGAGKGTICRLVASACGYSLLDSGSLYRLTALSAMRQSVDLSNETKVAELALALPVEFTTNGDQTCVMLDGTDVTSDIRQEQVGMGASVIAALECVREALLERQKSFAAGFGLVADGRDMGTVVFPDAELKIFLTASAAERARRRCLQLKQAGQEADFDAILKDVELRDERDSSRAASPLKPAEDAIMLDSTELSVSQVFEQIMHYVKEQNLRLNISRIT